MDRSAGIYLLPDVVCPNYRLFSVNRKQTTWRCNDPAISHPSRAPAEYDASCRLGSLWFTRLTGAPPPGDGPHEEEQTGEGYGNHDQDGDDEDADDDGCVYQELQYADEGL